MRRGDHHHRRVGETGFFGGGFGGDGGPAIQAALDRPSGVAVDGAGNLFIADSGNHRIRKVNAAGVISTVAGTESFSAGSAGTEARRSRLLWTALWRGGGRAGNIFIADTVNHRIRKVNAAGVISTVAGTEERGDGGPAVDAQLRNPSGVAADGTGNLFIADTGNHQIRKVDAAGTITTIAGSGETGFWRRVRRGRRPRRSRLLWTALWRGGGRGGQPLHRR